LIGGFRASFLALSFAILPPGLS